MREVTPVPKVPLLPPSGPGAPGKTAHPPRVLRWGGDRGECEGTGLGLRGWRCWAGGIMPRGGAPTT